MNSRSPIALDDEIGSKFETYLHGCGYRDARPLGNGLYACIMPLIFTHAIITGRIGDIYSYEDRWCFGGYTEAKSSLDRWDGEGEPTGWSRHPGSGRRRPDGDASREYFNR